ncbi:similar to Saccharomyces cerevisiae YBR097W VPS15 Myristoylated serine/threonine protein kinase involved in vacuolar protein sorting [Maudiozyma saulgeensis]|uniref:non-specific serine/threonine protein kinase n=1 Tax=Maudiozyma saulgeensis TaxID=1789683 RepID=A0A1X7R9E8_9SACH|nr:similar to Saccharomyces cerevisiae YBR097W VPS15 Myristoylated serine/threonine protein kinase involved in vacuolar protein sorting [Kazachstania saulgeensis]
MGVQLSILAQSSPSIGIFSYIDVLEDVHYIALLNSSRFLKTCKAVDPNGEIIIKVFVKPREGYSLTSTVETLNKESMLLSQLPNVLNYSKIIESNRAGYLIRQHLRRNLYDRLSSRPYLHEIESKFIAFQLLQALNDIHNLDIVHTDIKTENIMVNSWNWIALTDFAAHVKPIYLPEDNPGEFSFYFDTSKRRNCYIAPERFNTQLYNDSEKRYEPSKEMDIFSAGCCIAELFSEGIPIFNLSQLFKYKTQEYDVNEYLNEHFSENKELKELIMDMIQLDPTRRLSTLQLLEKYRGTFFPDYFYTFTYDYFRTLASLVTSIPNTGSLTEKCLLEDKQNVCNNSLLKVYDDFSSICASLNFPIITDKPKQAKDKLQPNVFSSEHIKIGHNTFVQLKSFTSYKSIQPVEEECALLFISYLSRILRNLTSSSNKIKCLELLAAFSQFISDDNKIDRVIPYYETCFEDENNSMIQALSLQCTTQVLSAVEQVNKLNENVFMDYLLPRIKRLLNRSKEHLYVRMVLANLVGNFVSLVSKFREISLMSRLNSNEQDNDESILTNNKYNGRLMQQMEEIIISLLTDSSVWVKISLLDNVLSLCKYLGKEKTNDIILSHLITYLNDRNPMLRMALVEAISGISILLGPVTLEQYILPLLIQTLTDSEELVVTATLETLHDLCKTGLVNQINAFTVANEISPLLLHPNYSIRQFSLLTLFEISQQLSKPDLYCNLYPIIKPYFGFEVEFELDVMLDSCKTPISRTIFNLLCSWSLRASNSLFWKQVMSKEVDAFGKPTSTFITRDYIPKNYGLTNNTLRSSKAMDEHPNGFVRLFDNSEIPLTTEDKLWIDKFKTLGMKDTDLWKLLCLRSYILRTKNKHNEKSQLGLHEIDENLDKKYSSIGIANVMPHNVFYDIKFIEQEETDSEELPLSENDTQKQLMEHSLLPKESVPTIVNMNGSLILRNKPSAITTPNLRNIYVQLEPNRTHNQVHNPYSPRRFDDRSFPIPEYVVSNSYEGDVESIEQFLKSIDISPTLSDYKEFGIISNAIKKDGRSLISLKGKSICTLSTNIRNLIVSICTSSGSRNPYLVTGSLQGVISVYSMRNIVNGEDYEPALFFNCKATLTNMIMLQGFDTFVVATTDGFVKFFRILQYDPLQENRQSTYTKEIRSFHVSGESNKSGPNGAMDGEEHVTKMEEYIADDKAYLICLTNRSRLFNFDIRRLDDMNFINIPASHGGITTFCTNKESNVLIIGTTKGIIDIWDLRLNILVNSWAFDNNCIIKEIHLMTQLGKNMILILGGSSSGVLSVWNYAKTQCRLIVALPERTPSIENFQPITKRLENVKYNSGNLNSIVSTVHTQGTTIIFSNNETSDMFMLDLSNTNHSKVLFGPNKSEYIFGGRKGTINTTIVSIQRVSSTTETTSSRKNTSNTGNMVTTIETVQRQDKLYLLVGDSLGIINIYD